MASRTNLIQPRISGVLVDSTALTAAGGVKYTDDISTKQIDGYASLLAVLAGGSPSITIDIQVSVDENNWYSPYDSSGNDVSNIVTALTASRYMAINIQLAPFIRFKLTPVADTTLTLQLVKSEYT